MNIVTIWVYPRTHGETSGIKAFPSFFGGLSPYTRGNQIKTSCVPAFTWSIPVHTGKPPEFRWFRVGGWVYPRTHGETLYHSFFSFLIEGLSPYTRGNLFGHRPGRAHSGSIPVHTGKPQHRAWPHSHCGVYPRTHGETLFRRLSVPKGKGLSPYTRGNQD